MVSERQNVGPDIGRIREGLFGLVCLSGWFAMFAVGVLVPSERFRVPLNTALDLQTLGLAALTFTYTNVAALTCIAGLLGGISSRLTFKGYEVAPDGNEGSRTTERTLHSISHAYRTENPIASMIRGFMVFVIYMAGLAIGMPGGSPAGIEASEGAKTFLFQNTSPDQYARVAALLSAVAFGAGYDPTVFNSIWRLMPASFRRKSESQQ